jgi:nucleotide-binding universal stress UspA family protein
MTDKKKIEVKKLKMLIPTDFSGHALNAGEFAMQLLKKSAGEVILENVYQVPKENSGTLISVNDIIISESKEKLQNEYNELKAKNKKLNITIQSDEGNPVTTVKNTLKKNHIDLLVIGHNSKMDKFSSAFIGQPEYWPALLVPGTKSTKIRKEAIIISASVNNAHDLTNAFTEIDIRFKDKGHQLFFTKNSTIEHLKATINALLEKHKVGIIIFNTTKGDRLEQVIKEHKLDSIFFSHPSLLISNNGE